MCMHKLIDFNDFERLIDRKIIEITLLTPRAIVNNFDRTKREKILS